jgi:NAD(P)-dependent dehydrogenase (short-subunit alcohol dehydrogenase family)
MDDLFSVEGKTAVVTGGSRGIGLMIARGLVEGGARVYVSSRKAEACQPVAGELSRVGECVAVPADLSSEAGCRGRFGDEIAAAAPLGRIGRPDDMAGAARYLASRAGANLTGVVLPVDGGLTL